MKIRHPALICGRARLLFCSERCRRLGREDLARHGSADWLDAQFPTSRPRDTFGRAWGHPVAGSPSPGEGSPAKTAMHGRQEGDPLGTLAGRS